MAAWRVIRDTMEWTRRGDHDHRSRAAGADRSRHVVARTSRPRGGHPRSPPHAADIGGRAPVPEKTAADARADRRQGSAGRLPGLLPAGVVASAGRDHPASRLTRPQSGRYRYRTRGHRARSAARPENHRAPRNGSTSRGRAVRRPGGLLTYSRSEFPFRNIGPRQRESRAAPPVAHDELPASYRCAALAPGPHRVPVRSSPDAVSGSGARRTTSIRPRTPGREHRPFDSPFQKTKKKDRSGNFCRIGPIFPK
ncbi:hypothetical protein UA74_25855 [Actinoalloteichus fjordicus]|uniref:Uncharacterized protein n=1 Tax=Actinoalloteichus fjordicus TaxID=1612552 RepID=A0AAC9LFW3_9PSEU|nr:hypothetical protein UA74_25855 [Actinoalloteichus fjordicus]